MMVAGIYQYEFARLLGFDRKKILMPLYSADTNNFYRYNKVHINLKAEQFPKNLLFVGRFEKEKGLELLVDAFLSICKNYDWTLTLIGNGSMKQKIQQKAQGNDIFIHEFLQPKDLVSFTKEAGVFCLPSSYEPWGVVIHEFVCAGLPVICSDTCGAASVFVKEGFNGFKFKTGSFVDLRQKLKLLFELSDSELLTYSKNSISISRQITPKLVAANFKRFMH
jgi:glycosyltransferase involved in cell wall biosynthesis